MINQAYRYELKPNNRERTLLAKHAGTARFTYNWGLDQRIREYEGSGKSSNAIEQHRQLNILKTTDYLWMYEVSKCAPQEALRDLDRAFKNFYRGRKSKKNIGFPKFKKKGIHDSFRLTGSIHVSDRYVSLPRLGTLRTKETTHIQGDILSATVSKEADRWYVSLQVERQPKEQFVLKDTPIGIDLGINCFAVLSDGTRIQSPQPLKRLLRLLKRRSRQHSQKEKGSNNRRKSVLTLSRLHQRIRNQRKDFLNKLSSTLAKTKSVIVTEELNVQGMIRNRSLARYIQDQGWGEFMRMLSYKTQWYGTTLLKAPRFYPSSQICSACGTREGHLNLKDRSFTCRICQYHIDRDLNAARNLLKLTTGSSPGIDACGDAPDGGTQEHLRSTSYVSEKQEADTKYAQRIFG